MALNCHYKYQNPKNKISKHKKLKTILTKYIINKFLKKIIKTEKLGIYWKK